MPVLLQSPDILHMLVTDPILFFTPIADFNTFAALNSYPPCNYPAFSTGSVNRRR